MFPMNNMTPEHISSALSHTASSVLPEPKGIYRSLCLPALGELLASMPPDTPDSQDDLMTYVRTNASFLEFNNILSSRPIEQFVYLLDEWSSCGRKVAIVKEDKPILEFLYLAGEIDVVEGDTVFVVFPPDSFTRILYEHCDVIYDCRLACDVLYKPVDTGRPYKEFSYIAPISEEMRRQIIRRLADVEMIRLTQQKFMKCDIEDKLTMRTSEADSRLFRERLLSSLMELSGIKGEYDLFSVKYLPYLSGLVGMLHLRERPDVVDDLLLRQIQDMCSIVSYAADKTSSAFWVRYKDFYMADAAACEIKSKAARWLSASSADILLDTYRAGVPVEDLLA